jgi:hypothetical protein
MEMKTAGAILNCAMQKLLAKNLPAELLPRNPEANDWTTIRTECDLTLSEVLSLKNYLSQDMVSNLQKALTESMSTSEQAVNDLITEKENQLVQYKDLMEQHKGATFQLACKLEESRQEFTNIEKHNMELSDNNTTLQKVLVDSMSSSEQAVNETYQLQRELKELREEYTNVIGIEEEPFWKIIENLLEEKTEQNTKFATMRRVLEAGNIKIKCAEAEIIELRDTEPSSSSQEHSFNNKENLITGCSSNTSSSPNNKKRKTLIHNTRINIPVGGHMTNYKLRGC